MKKIKNCVLYIYKKDKNYTDEVKIITLYSSIKKVLYITDTNEYFLINPEKPNFYFNEIPFYIVKAGIPNQIYFKFKKSIKIDFEKLIKLKMIEK